MRSFWYRNVSGVCLLSEKLFLMVFRYIRQYLSLVAWLQKVVSKTKLAWSKVIWAKI